MPRTRRAMREIRQESPYHYVFSPYVEPIATVESGETNQLLTQVGTMYVGNMVDTYYSLVAGVNRSYLS